MKELVSYYLAIFLRRFHYFAIVFVLFAAVSITAAKMLPAVYESNARLLVESSQIPTNLAAPTVQTQPGEELQIIEQRLMTRAHLLKIARDFNVFENMGEMAADDIVQGMRDATTIRRFAGRNQATLMSITFEARTGQIAASVVNEYVTIILQDNAELRASRAGSTLQFFQAEVDRLGKELEKQSARILNFKNANADALPDTLTFRLQQQTNFQQTLASNEQQIAALQDQKRRMLDVFEKTGQVGPVANANLTPEQRQLAALQDQLRQALAIYSPENPKVKVLEAQIAQLEPVVRGQADPDAPVDPQRAMLDVQLAGIDAQIEALQQQSERIKAQLAKLQDGIDRTPSVQIELDALTRDYSNIQGQYNTAVARLAQAATGERIEVLSKGQRIAVIESGTVPNAPARPNRPLIAIGGTAFGAFAGIALVALLEFLNRSIRRPIDISRKLGITPIATVPYIRTPMEMVLRRAVFVAVFVAIAIGIPALLYAVDTYYMPLDLVVERVSGTLRGFL